MSERVVLRSRWLVAFCWVAAVGIFVLFVVTAAIGPGPDPGPIDYIGTVAFGLVLSLLFVRAARMRVELDDRGVKVFRLFKTELVPWSDLAGVSVDYNGLRLERKDGRVVTAGSLGKPNWAKWFDRRVAADERVDIIERELAKRRPSDAA